MRLQHHTLSREPREPGCCAQAMDAQIGVQIYVDAFTACYCSAGRHGARAPGPASACGRMRRWVPLPAKPPAATKKELSACMKWMQPRSIVGGGPGSPPSLATMHVSAAWCRRMRAMQRPSHTFLAHDKLWHPSLVRREPSSTCCWCIPASRCSPRCLFRVLQLTRSHTLPSLMHPHHRWSAQLRGPQMHSPPSPASWRRARSGRERRAGRRTRRVRRLTPALR